MRFFFARSTIHGGPGTQNPNRATGNSHCPKHCPIPRRGMCINIVCAAQTHAVYGKRYAHSTKMLTRRKTATASSVLHHLCKPGAIAPGAPRPHSTRMPSLGGSTTGHGRPIFVRCTTPPQFITLRSDTIASSSSTQISLMHYLQCQQVLRPIVFNYSSRVLTPSTASVSFVSFDQADQTCYEISQQTENTLKVIIQPSKTEAVRWARPASAHSVL